MKIRDEVNSGDTVGSLESLVQGSIVLYHGSPNFKGSSFSLENVGIKNEISDANGFAVYLTSNFDIAREYAGKNGVIVQVKLKLDNKKNASNVSANNFKALLELAIKKSPHCIDYFIDCGYELRDDLPLYDFECGGYKEPDTSNIIKISQTDFSNKFGGLENLFDNKYNFNNKLKTTNVVAIKISELCEYSLNLSDALLSIESDMYRLNYAKDNMENKIKNRDLAMKLLQEKVENKIDLSFYKVSDDEYQATVYNLEILKITKIIKI